MSAEMFVLLNHFHLSASSYQDGPHLESSQMSVQLGRKDVYPTFRKSLQDRKHRFNNSCEL